MTEQTVKSAPDLRRILIRLHYDGAGFHGWQLQPMNRTVQGELEAAIEQLTGAHRPVLGAGRTDRGVHATGQAAAVDVPARWSAAALRKALNAILPRDIWVSRADQVSPDLHPRYRAVARTYHYKIGTTEQSKSPFHHPYCWPVGTEIDLERANRIASVLIGKHSFQAFAKAGQPERGYRCVVDAAGWSAWSDLGATFQVRADRYLHHMVRYLVGTQMAILLGQRSESDLAALLQLSEAEVGKHLITSPPAPPQGLYLTDIEYPEALLRAENADPPRQGADSHR